MDMNDLEYERMSPADVLVFEKHFRDWLKGADRLPMHKVMQDSNTLVFELVSGLPCIVILLTSRRYVPSKPGKKAIPCFHLCSDLYQSWFCNSPYPPMLSFASTTFVMWLPLTINDKKSLPFHEKSTRSSIHRPPGLALLSKRRHPKLMRLTRKRQKDVESRAKNDKRPTRGQIEARIGETEKAI
jgi:hypothetical protein